MAVDCFYPINISCNVSVNHSIGQPPDTTGDRSYIINALLARFLQLCFCLLGVFTNILNCHVFHCQGLRDRMNLCLFSLALVDFKFLLWSAVLSFINNMNDLLVPSFNGEVNIWAIGVCMGVIYALKTTSGLYIMVIAVERCICILFPLKAVHLMRTRTMLIIIIAFALIPQLAFICEPLKYKLIKVEVNGIAQWKFIHSDIWIAHKYLLDTLVYTIFSVSVPLITFLVVSLATFVSVIRLTAAAAWRQKTSSTKVEGSSQQITLTKMLVIACCVYIVFSIPMVVIKVVRLFVEEFSAVGVYSRLYTLYNLYAQLFPVMYSSVTFFIYYSRSSRYRNILSKISCKSMLMKYLSDKQRFG